MALFLFTISSILMCVTATPLVSRQLSGVVMSGEYAIVNCGANANNVVTMLETLWGALIQATQDAESFTMNPAYQTFFTDPGNMAFVSNILAYSSAGAAIHPPTAVTNGAPVIVCLSAAGQLAGTLPDGSRFDAYNDCREKSTPSAQSLSGTPYIGICPYFWDSGLGTIAPVPPPNKCLSVNAKNKFNLDRLGRAGPSLTQYGMWVLLEEIVHIYLIPEQTKRGLLNQISDYEVYDANDVLALSADYTLMNAHSYLLYAASIYGHCTDFPSPPGTRPPERILAAASSNDALPPGPTFTGDPAGVDDTISNVVVFPQGSIHT